MQVGTRHWQPVQRLQGPAGGAAGACQVVVHHHTGRLQAQGDVDCLLLLYVAAAMELLELQQQLLHDGLSCPWRSLLLTRHSTRARMPAPR
jgi:hypothetical protein